MVRITNQEFLDTVKDLDFACFTLNTDILRIENRNSTIKDFRIERDRICVDAVSFDLTLPILMQCQEDMEFETQKITDYHLRFINHRFQIDIFLKE